MPSEHGIPDRTLFGILAIYKDTFLYVKSNRRMTNPNIPNAIFFIIAFYLRPDTDG